MPFTMRFPIVYTLFLVFMTGCNRYQVIPDQLAGKINTTITYEHAKAATDAARGQIVVWGGVVLNAARDTESTTVEILGLPLDKDHIPLDNRASSPGRFLAIDSKGGIIDPAIFKDGSRVTVIGELLGLRTETRDEAAYDYPVIAIRDLTLWEKRVLGSLPTTGLHHYFGYGNYGYKPYASWEGTRVAADKEK